MAKRMHKKNKNKDVQMKLDLLNRSKERQMMPRPAVFKDKTKYDRNREKAGIRKELCCA